MAHARRRSPRTWFAGSPPLPRTRCADRSAVRMIQLHQLWISKSMAVKIYEHRINSIQCIHQLIVPELWKLHEYRNTCASVEPTTPWNDDNLREHNNSLVDSIELTQNVKIYYIRFYSPDKLSLRNKLSYVRFQAADQLFDIEVQVRVCSALPKNVPAEKPPQVQSWLWFNSAGRPSSAENNSRHKTITTTTTTIRMQSRARADPQQNNKNKNTSSREENEGR